MTGELVQMACGLAIFVGGFMVGRGNVTELRLENEMLGNQAYEDAKRCDIDRMTADELRVHAAAMHRKLEDMRMYAQDLLEYAGDNPCGLCDFADECERYEASKPGACMRFDKLVNRARNLGLEVG